MWGVMELMKYLYFCNCPGAGDVWFSLNNTTYQNNSLVTLEDIGSTDKDSLNCGTNLTECCRGPPPLGNWVFPNGSKVPSENSTSEQLDFYRRRGPMVVRMKHKSGGDSGIYGCEIPDVKNVTQTIYIGIYAESSGE